MKQISSIFAIFLALLCVIFVQAVDKSVCTLPKETGTCRAAATFYYYDSGSKQCQSFIYGGCEGNDNRFKTKAECEKICL